MWIIGIINLVLRNDKSTEIHAGVAEWQTHLTQNQAGKTVGVQVPSPAPQKDVPIQSVRLFLFILSVV